MPAGDDRSPVGTGLFTQWSPRMNYETPTVVEEAVLTQVTGSTLPSGTN
jgi:hypothetical protein